MNTKVCTWFCDQNNSDRNYLDNIFYYLFWLVICSEYEWYYTPDQRLGIALECSQMDVWKNEMFIFDTNTQSILEQTQLVSIINKYLNIYIIRVKDIQIKEWMIFFWWWSVGWTPSGDPCQKFSLIRRGIIKGQAISWPTSLIASYKSIL